MRRTLLISTLTAIVVMAIAVFAAPRLGTAIAGPDSPEAVAASNAATIAMAVEKAKKLTAFAAAHPKLFKSNDVTASTVEAAGTPEGPSSCCTSWQGFNITGTLPAPLQAGLPCNTCGPGLHIPFPQGTAFIGNNWSTVLTFHSEIPGPCTVTMAWWSVPLNQFIAGGPENISDCGGNNIWWVSFPVLVPNGTAGPTIAIGIIQASDGTTDVDYTQFVIR